MRGLEGVVQGRRFSPLGYVLVAVVRLVAAVAEDPFDKTDLQTSASTNTVKSTDGEAERYAADTDDLVTAIEEQSVEER